MEQRARGEEGDWVIQKEQVQMLLRQESLPCAVLHNRKGRLSCLTRPPAFLCVKIVLQPNVVTITYDVFCTPLQHCLFRVIDNVPLKEFLQMFCQALMGKVRWTPDLTQTFRRLTTGEEAATEAANELMIGE